MISNNATARLAGFFYLVLLVLGVYSIVYLPSQFIVWDNASQTVENIRNSEGQFRLGIVTTVFAYLASLFLSLTLFKLLREVNKTYSFLMLVFVLISIPINFNNLQHRFSILTLIKSPEPSANLQNQVMLHLEYFSNGVQLSSLFWGLSLLPLGYLIFKSGFIPKILGILLMIGFASYVMEFFGKLLTDEYSNTIFPVILGWPSSFGEFGLCLWLLIIGIKKRKVNSSTPGL